MKKLELLSAAILDNAEYHVFAPPKDTLREDELTFRRFISERPRKLGNRIMNPVMRARLIAEVRRRPPDQRRWITTIVDAAA